MYWAFNAVYQNKPVQISEKEGFALELASFIRHALISRAKEPLLLHDLREMWGQFFQKSDLFKKNDPVTSTAMMSDGALFLEQIYDQVFVPDCTAPVESQVLINRGNEHDGAVRFEVSAVLSRPFQVIYVTDRPMPRRLKAMLNNPVMYCMATCSNRAQRSMGVPRKKMRPPLLISTYELQIRAVPGDAAKYNSGPHWSRTLECMDLLGVYLRVSRSCRTCRFEPICSESMCDVRRMKSSGPNKNVDRARILKRNQVLKHGRDSTEPDTPDNPDLQ